MAMADDYKVGVVALICGSLLLGWIVFNLASCSDQDNAHLRRYNSSLESKIEECHKICGGLSEGSN